MKIPTVKIAHPDGYCIINQSDFNADIHELYEQPSVSPAPKETGIKLVDLNTSSQAELTALPTIGAIRAKSIIANRPYKSIAEAQKKLPDLNWADIENLIVVE